ncbi:MAG: Flp pilus assembly protein CpaB [Candidatus Aceula meridiana]|nr:Flp pilus assembly protein CpaB [Candidatus Aceula meridiana]
MPVDLKKIDKKKAGIIIVAIVAGLGAVALTNNYINSQVSQGANPEAIEQMMGKIQQLEQNDQALYEKQKAAAQQLSQQISAVAQQRAQSPTRESGEKSPVADSLALRTPSNKRAITIQIQTLSAVGGLLNPGDYVDILAHLDIPLDLENPAQAFKTIVTLFQHVQILAIGTNVSQPSDFESHQKAGSLPITFAVDPQQAELLTFAEKNGKLQLILRSPEEDLSYQVEPANWGSLEKYLQETQGIDINAPAEPNQPKKKTATPKRTPARSIQVIRAGKPDGGK